jgi:ABC-type branched-subunit amino acid transport system ATPase component
MTEPTTKAAPAEPDSSPLLEARGLTVQFGGVRALDAMDLTVARRSVHGIIGPNGSGKSTLLGVLSRLTRHKSGTMRLDGVEFGRLPPHRLASLGLARTFQTVRLLSTLTVLENVMVAVSPVTGSGDLLTRSILPRRSEREPVIRRTARECLRELDIEDTADRMPAELPYGIARRVEIARALATRPRILLVDEPTAGMSQAERFDIGQVLARLPERGCSVVLVEHDVDLITTYCDWATAMNAGGRIVEGRPADVVNNAEVREAYMGQWSDDWS